MRAAQYYGPGDVRVEEAPEPQVKQGQVKLKLAWYVNVYCARGRL